VFVAGLFSVTTSVDLGMVVTQLTVAGLLLEHAAPGEERALQRQQRQQHAALAGAAAAVAAAFAKPSIAGMQHEQEVVR
jgi:hypothetical protein